RAWAAEVRQPEAVALDHAFQLARVADGGHDHAGQAVALLLEQADLVAAVLALVGIVVAQPRLVGLLQRPPAAEVDLGRLRAFRCDEAPGRAVLGHGRDVAGAGAGGAQAAGRPGR